MVRIHADKRSRDVDPAAAAKRLFRERLARARNDEVDMALALRHVAEKRGHAFEDLKSVNAWAVAQGCGAAQARRLLALGRVLGLAPDLVAKVRSGEICSESAVQLGRLFGEEKIDLSPEARAAWLERAAAMDPDGFREAVSKAVDDARQGAPTYPLRFQVTRRTYRGFERVRLILSKGLPRLVTEGQALGHLVDDWRRRNDPRVAPLPKRGRRRSSGRTRHVPARVKALVERRSGGLCECCGVARATTLMHLRPYADGGDQTAEGLAHGCADCHFFVDRGVWLFVRWTEKGKAVWTFNPDRLRPIEEDDAAPWGADDGGAGEVREAAPPRYEARPPRRGVPRRQAPPRGTSTCPRP